MTNAQLKVLRNKYLREGYKMGLKEAMDNDAIETRYRKIRSGQDSGRKMITDLYNNMDEIIAAYDADYNPYKVKKLKQLKKILSDCANSL